jgi:hypothetical protein
MRGHGSIQGERTQVDDPKGLSLPIRCSSQRRTLYVHAEVHHVLFTRNRARSRKRSSSQRQGRPLRPRSRFRWCGSL